MSTHYLLFGAFAVAIILFLLVAVLLTDQEKKIKLLELQFQSACIYANFMRDAYCENLKANRVKTREINDMVLAIYGSRTIDRNCRDVTRLVTDLQKANHSLQERLEQAIRLLPAVSGAFPIRKEGL